MPLSLLNHSALALFAQRTRIPTSARSIGFCAIWVCISSSSSYFQETTLKKVDPNFADRSDQSGRPTRPEDEWPGNRKLQYQYPALQL